MGTVFDSALRPLGITAAQAGVLLHLDRYPEATMAELSRLAAVTPQTMHRLVVGMERRGLVQRRPLGEDRKSLEVAITGQGAELLGRAEVTLMREQEAVLEGFTPSELDQFAGFLDRFERVYSSRLAAGVA
jgi:DNA-binding MarR family transcriptional regulator